MEGVGEYLEKLGFGMVILVDVFRECYFVFLGIKGVFFRFR